MIVMNHWKFILSKKNIIILVNDVNNDVKVNNNNNNNGAVHVWGQGIYEKSLYLLLNFVINLNCSKNMFKKKNG